MAYSSFFPPRLVITNGNVDDPGVGLAEWSYLSPTDSIAVVSAPNYFNPAPSNMQVGDLVNVFDVKNIIVQRFYISSVVNNIASLSNISAGTTTAAAASRTLTIADNGNTIDCTTASITFTVPAGLPIGFACSVIPNGTTSIASSGGTLLNGATTTITRTSASNASFSILSKSVANSFVVNGV